MKIVVNKCYGGFGLSPEAVERYAKKKGRKCFFFSLNIGENSRYSPLEKEDISRGMIWAAFDTPNKAQFKYPANWGELPLEERKKINDNYSKHEIPSGGEIDRSDPDLVAVVEALGKKASGMFAELKIVTIPDDVDWEIEEYDGMESVHEKHRSW